MKALLLATCVFAASYAIAGDNPAASSSSGAEQAPQLQHFSPANADASANACQDFFKYADGKWVAAHPIPGDMNGWGVARILQLWNETQLRDTLEKASRDDPARNSDEQKAGDFYYSCSDEKTLNSETAAWLKPELDRIARINSKADIAAEVAHLHQSVDGAYAPADNQTAAAVMGFSGQPGYDDASHYAPVVDQGGLGMPTRSFYLDQDEKSKDIRAKYLKHVQNMLSLAGEKPEQAKKDADVVMEMETEMARASMDPISRRDPKNLNNKMTLDQLKALAPSFDWQLYLKLVDAPTAQQYIVTTPAFFKNLESMLQQHPVEHWKSYLRWQMLHGNATALSDAFSGENFDFFGRTLQGTPNQLPRWRRCVQSVDGSLGEVLGKVYVARAFSPQSKQRVLQMVSDIEAALGRDIEAQDWMSPETKAQAKQKLAAVMNKIGYPDHWRDYSAVKIGRASYPANQHNAVQFEFERWVHKIGNPVDRSEWGMTPPTVDAYENPQDNTINFPAGILHAPYFDPEQDDAVNYGAIGAIIGHETIHGFDDQGRKFDLHGNLRDWWTPSDGSEYEARGKCISDEYTQPVPEAGAGVKQDGRMTQGEDTADNGGLHLAFMALQSDLARQGKDMDANQADGLTPRQRFFLAYGFAWAGLARQESIRTLVLTNPHSYRTYRVNNVVSNMPEFWQAFSCKKGDPMVREHACRIW
ncbi:MAG TPA: M13 family metallopeptidase [Candidatus Angelobacter sp.]|nr:M13 family metallopeptidase [Candidatus Angelobacter sp.]